MLFNIIAGFVIPWFVVIPFFPREKIFLLIWSISSVVALSINTIRFYFFWGLKPIFKKEQSISRLPIDLGLYPLLGCYMVYLIRSGFLNAYILILLFTLLTTITELIALKIEKVIYYNGWNGYWTSFSYLIAYGLVYYYYILLKIHDIL